MKTLTLNIKIDRGSLTREIARERVGQPQPRSVMTPKTRRRPKHRERFRSKFSAISSAD